MLVMAEITSIMEMRGGASSILRMVGRSLAVLPRSAASSRSSGVADREVCSNRTNLGGAIQCRDTNGVGGWRFSGFARRSISFRSRARRVWRTWRRSRLRRCPGRSRRRPGDAHCQTRQPREEAPSPSGACEFGKQRRLGDGPANACRSTSGQPTVRQWSPPCSKKPTEDEICVHCLVVVAASRRTTLGVLEIDRLPVQHLNCALAPELQLDILELRNPPGAG